MNEDGEAIGVVSAKLDGFGVSNVGFAMPLDQRDGGSPRGPGW